MGIPVYFGQKLYGQIDNPDGTSDATRFFHIYYVPLIPTGGYRLRGLQAEPSPMRLLSVASAYLKIWGLLFVIGLGIWAYDEVYRGATVTAALWPPALTIVLMLLLFSSWFWLGRRGTHYQPSTTRTVAIPLILILPTVLVAGVFAQRWKDRELRSRFGSSSSALSDPQQTLAALASVMHQSDLKSQIAAQQKQCTDGSASNCVNLGVRYLKGDGVATDGAFAATLFERACNAKDGIGCMNAGIVANNGQGGMKRDPARALESYKKGCELGSADCCNNYGNMIEKGEGAPADIATAAVYYGKACAARNGFACNNLARFYEQGLGVAKSRSHADAFRRQACAYGRTSACGKSRR